MISNMNLLRGNTYQHNTTIPINLTHLTDMDFYHSNVV